MNKYYCEQCEKEVDDNGPYETSHGEYECQDCMEGRNEYIRVSKEKDK